LDDLSNIQWLCANCHEDKTRLENTGRPGPNKGRKFSNETCCKMAESARLRQERGGHTKGLKFSDERRKAHSEALKRAFKERPRIMPPASDDRKRKVSESLRRYHAEKKASLGYIGSSTRSELDYAVKHGKVIRYLESARVQSPAEGKEPQP
jgi:hypothetical protein